MGIAAAGPSADALSRWWLFPLPTLAVTVPTVASHIAVPRRRPPASNSQDETDWTELASCSWQSRRVPSCSIAPRFPALDACPPNPWPARHHPRTPTLAELGARVGASERTLSRLLGQELRMSFHQWRTQLPVQNALTRLAAGKSVTDTALACGWANPTSFIEAFAALVGETPGRYRNRQLVALYGITWRGLDLRVCRHWRGRSLRRCACEL
ncbi:helix-turn-helix domain-containing protein [Streptomyces niveus]|uniref:helix-turn-helix domain-containing protein n=1 Tax=Streptomyces niveus TaxID=193462 RepID=UPI0036685F28